MSYTQPLILVFLAVALLGLLGLSRYKGWLFPLAGLTGLFLVSWPPADWLFSRPLELQYPLQSFPNASAQAIVVLSSDVKPPSHERPYALPDKDTFERCRFTAWLYQHWQPLPVLACGGLGKRSRQPFSVTMRQLLQQEGVPDAMIWTEEKSHSTHENAVYGAEILQQHGIRKIALVMDAQSMPRAEACFRKQGIEVVPAPCAFRRFGPLSEELMPSWKAIQRNEITLHEAVGLLWYWLHGWI